MLGIGSDEDARLRDAPHLYRAHRDWLSVLHDPFRLDRWMAGAVDGGWVRERRRVHRSRRRGRCHLRDRRVQGSRPCSELLLTRHRALREPNPRDQEEGLDSRLVPKYPSNFSRDLYAIL